MFCPLVLSYDRSSSSARKKGGEMILSSQCIIFIIYIAPNSSAFPVKKGHWHFWLPLPTTSSSLLIWASQRAGQWHPIDLRPSWGFVTIITTKYLLTHGCPGKAHYHSRGSHIIHSIHREDGLPNKVLEIFRCHINSFCFPTDNLVSRFPKHLSQRKEGSGREETGTLYGRPSINSFASSAKGKYLTFSTCFWRFLTPLSRQYCLMRTVSTSGVMLALVSSNPHKTRAWGTKYLCEEGKRDPGY